MNDVKIKIEIKVEIREGAEVYQMKMKNKKKWENGPGMHKLYMISII
jgi:hypothetical protein